jgi:hypothetical protein
LVRVCDTFNGKQIASSQADKGPVRHFAISPDGTRVAVGGTGQRHVAVVDLLGLK